MLKKAVLSIIILSFALCAVSCKNETKELICDGCGKVVEVEADSNMTDEWIIFCGECGEPEISYEQ